MPLTAAEVRIHPAFPSVLWDLKPTTKGTVAVASTRGGPFNIAYEIHGSGPIRLAWIAGLGAFKWYWQRQTKDFGHDEGSKYSCLIFDNRGMGDSDKPMRRYSTTEMAKDTLQLIDHLRWTAKRQIHVIGVSMGGMIAQELAYLEPERIASLSLISTAAKLVNTVGYLNHLRSRINILIPKSLDVQLAESKTRLSTAYLTAPDTDNAFPTNGDRFAAQEITKRLDTTRFTRIGFLCQAQAAAWHQKSPAQLQQLADRVGRDRILVMHGTIDILITVAHAEALVDGLGGEDRGVTRIMWEDKGHYLVLEETVKFRDAIVEMVSRTEALA